MPTSDSTFVAELDAAVAGFLRAVDAWESEFRKPDRQMGEVHRNYVQARHQLETRVPRARRLCARCGVRDPFPALMRVSLGSGGIAVGRNERSSILQTLVQLAAAADEPESTASRTFLQRIRGFLLD